MQIIDKETAKLTFDVAIVVSRFNQEVTKLLLTGALDRLQQLNFSNTQIQVVKVPGAVEIPIVAQTLAQSKKYKAIICLGSVIRGETSHYDYVCKQVSDGCQQVALQYDIPVIFGVLTTDNDVQALARVSGQHGHGHKGKDAVDAACEMVAIMRELQTLST